LGRDLHELPELNERLRDILQAVVEDYIATAEPVGSRSLTKRNSRLDLSPATVRNAMGDLEDLGFLSAPHASAGRIPTVLAFRVYVERLASRGRISAREQDIINAIAQPGDASRELSQVLHDASRALSGLANHAALVLLPRLDEVVFADIEFVPVRERSVLVVFVAKSGLVQNRLVDVDFPLDRDELRRMSAYLQSLLTGKSLAEVRDAILAAMRDERAQADEMMRNALSLGERALSATPPAGAESVVVAGERTLFNQPEFADIAKMRNLLRAFEEKTVLLRLLDATRMLPVDSPLVAERSATQIAFGAEGSVRELKELAVVVSAYSSTEGPTGQVGVVGPLRMDYSRVIPLVEYTAAALSRSFGDAAEPGGEKKR
jgi:heat-inducible transcriptional repressor